MGGAGSKLKKTEKQLQISQTNVSTLKSNNAILRTMLEVSKKKSTELEQKILQFRAANVKNVTLLRKLQKESKEQKKLITLLEEGKTELEKQQFLSTKTQQNLENACSEAECNALKEEIEGLKTKLDAAQEEQEATKEKYRYLTQNSKTLTAGKKVMEILRENKKVKLQRNQLFDILNSDRAIHNVEKSRQNELIEELKSQLEEKTNTRQQTLNETLKLQGMLQQQENEVNRLSRSLQECKQFVAMLSAARSELVKQAKFLVNENERLKKQYIYHQKLLSTTTTQNTKRLEEVINFAGTLINETKTTEETKRQVLVEKYSRLLYRAKQACIDNTTILKSTRPYVVERLEANKSPISFVKLNSTKVVASMMNVNVSNTGFVQIIVKTSTTQGQIRFRGVTNLTVLKPNTTDILQSNVKSGSADLFPNLPFQVGTSRIGVLKNAWRFSFSKSETPIQSVQIFVFDQTNPASALTNVQLAMTPVEEVIQGPIAADTGSGGVVTM